MSEPSSTRPVLHVMESAGGIWEVRYQEQVEATAPLMVGAIAAADEILRQDAGGWIKLHSSDGEVVDTIRVWVVVGAH